MIGRACGGCFNHIDDWHIIVAITIILSSTLLIFLFVEKRKRSLQ